MVLILAFQINSDSHKYVVAKGARIDRALAHNFGNFASLNTRNFRVL